MADQPTQSQLNPIKLLAQLNELMTQINWYINRCCELATTVQDKQTEASLLSAQVQSERETRKSLEQKLTVATGNNEALRQAVNTAIAGFREGPAEARTEETSALFLALEEALDRTGKEPG